MWTEENQLDNSIQCHPGWIADYLKKNREQILKERKLNIFYDAQKAGIPVSYYRDSEVATFTSQFFGEIVVQVRHVAEGVAILKAKEEEKRKKEEYHTRQLYFININDVVRLAEQEIITEAIRSIFPRRNYPPYLRVELEKLIKMTFEKHFNSLGVHDKDDLNLLRNFQNFLYRTVEAHHSLDNDTFYLYCQLLYKEKRFTLRQLVVFSMKHPSMFPGYVKGEPFAYPESVQRVLHSGSEWNRENEVFTISNRTERNA